MAAKITGISRELLIHPGETIENILKDRDITQSELATMAGVTPAYISEVISGKKNISAEFARALEHSLGVSKTFWLNLQTNYDSQLMKLNEAETVTDEEHAAKGQTNGSSERS